MKALSESHKMQIADAFCKTLVRVLTKDESGNEQISDEDKNKVFDDLENLKIFTNGQKWQELLTYLKSIEHLPKEKKRVSEGIKEIKRNGLRSELVKDWVLLHLKEDFLNVLEISLRRFNNYVLPITIEVPNFVNLDTSCTIVRYEGNRRDVMRRRILERKEHVFKTTNKIVLIKYDIIEYPKDVPEKLVINQTENFESLTINPFPNYVA